MSINNTHHESSSLKIEISVKHVIPLYKKEF